MKRAFTFSRTLVFVITLSLVTHPVEVLPSPELSDTLSQTAETAPPVQGNDSASEIESVPLYTLLTATGDVYHFGLDVTSIGDTNGDGTDDLIIGYFVEDLTDEGKPLKWGNYLLPGRMDHSYTSSQLDPVYKMSTSWYSTFERRLGDVNGDGLDDMVSFERSRDREWEDFNVKAPNHLDVRYGRAAGFLDDPDVRIPIGDPSSNGRWELPEFGGVGDVDGDGIDDLCVRNGQRLELYRGSMTGLPQTPSSTTTLIKPSNAHDRWDRYLRLNHGDVNGDGHSDIIISNIAGPWLTVYNGTGGGVDPNPSPNEFIKYNHNIWVHAPMNVNGDGCDDVIIGYLDYKDGERCMALDVHLGSPKGLSKNRSSRFLIGYQEYYYHRCNILAVDINGDSLDDILVEHDEARNWTVGDYNKTEYSVFLNTGGEFPERPHFQFKVQGDFESYGWARFGMNGVGDFDGDGLEDVAIGIPDGMAYYFESEWEDPIRPGHLLIIHGAGVMDRIATVKLVGGPTLYPEHKAYDFVANIKLVEGIGLPRKVSLTLDPEGANASLVWDGDLQGNPFTVGSDPLGCVKLESASVDVELDPSTDLLRLHFKVVPQWTWPHDGMCDVLLDVSTGTSSSTPLKIPHVFRVETDLELSGDIEATGEWQGPLEDGQWVRAGEEVTVTGFSVVYEGSTDVGPPEGTCNVALHDDDGDSVEVPWTVDGPMSLLIDVDNATDPDENLTLTLTGMPGNAALVSDWSIHLPVDGDLPTFRNAVPEAEDWHSISHVLVSITAWDGNTSGVDASTLEYQYSTMGTVSYTEWGREGLETTSDGPEADGLVWLDLPDGDANYVRWRVRDLVGNGHAVSEPLNIKVDTMNVTYSNAFPDPDEWFTTTTVECGVVIEDLEGAGIDVSTIQYRVSPRNLSQYGDWLDWDEGSQEDAEIVTTRQVLELADSGRNYVQWRAFDIAGNGLTTSPHYRVRVDATAPWFGAFEPGANEPQKSNTVTCWVEVQDNDGGSGVDLASVHYRYRTADEGEWSDWIDAGMDGQAHQARFSIVLQLATGTDNNLQLRCSDIAGNGPVESARHQIVVDAEPPVFLWIEPGADERQAQAEVLVTMAVKDSISGVDVARVMCRHGTAGEQSLGNWQPVEVIHAAGDYSLGSVSINFSMGRDNVVQFTAADLAGNEALSEVRSVWVNSPPVSVISSPEEGAFFCDNERVPLGAEGTHDPDGGELNYTWEVNGTPLAFGREANVTLVAGAYNITLTVTDDSGASDTASVRVTVEEWVPPHPEEEGLDLGLVISIVVLIIVVLLVVGYLVWKRRTTV